MDCQNSEKPNKSWHLPVLDFLQSSSVIKGQTAYYHIIFKLIIYRQVKIVVVGRGVVVGLGHLGSVGYGPLQSGGHRGSNDPGLKTSK